MHKVKRKRNKAVTIRMTKDEYDDLQNRVKESGLSQQAFIIGAIHGSTITSSDEIAVLKEISKTFSDHERQMRGMATNVNQMAHVLNGQGFIPAEKELKGLSSQFGDYRKESENIWRSIRLSINHQTATGQ